MTAPEERDRTGWADHHHRSAMRDASACPVCQAGARDVVAELAASWVTVPQDAPLPGYVCLVAKRHVVEPFELPLDERLMFWEDVNQAAAALDRELRPMKLNYEIHGNTLPHLHLHLFPRHAGDRFEGRPIDAREMAPRSDDERSAILRVAQTLSSDPYAPLKERAWQEVAQIDAQLERGEIDESGWHQAMADLIVPAYLAAITPWEGSGKSGTAEGWERARSHVAHAIEGAGSFLDIGCANGYLLECLPRWTPYALDRYGLDISPQLVELARRRLPGLADRLFVGNALEWEPPHRFTYVRTGLEYVPRHRRRQLLQRLLGWSDRVIVGVFNEEAHARPTEELIRSWGFRIAGRTDRTHPTKPGMAYRVLWIDA